MDEDRRQPLSAQDFDAIEAAVMETARGRWFLAEFARRNRHADTQMLLEAVARVEGAVRAQAGPGDSGEEVLRLRRGIADMADTVSRTRDELAATGEAGRDAFEAVLTAAEQADRGAFEAAEHVQEIARSLRETGAGSPAREALDREALAIHRAASQHALTTHRVRRIIGVLRDIEHRLQSLLREPGQAACEEKAQPAEEAPLVRRASAGAVTSPDDLRPRPVRPQPEPPQDPRAFAFAAIDALEPEQKLALFV